MLIEVTLFYTNFLTLLNLLLILDEGDSCQLEQDLEGYKYTWDIRYSAD